MSATFEVLIPGDPQITVTIEAGNWLGALRLVLDEFCIGDAPSEAACKIQADGSIQVQAGPEGQLFVIRRLDGKKAGQPSAEPEVAGPADVTGPPAAKPAPARPITLSGAAAFRHQEAAPLPAGEGAAAPKGATAGAHYDQATFLEQPAVSAPIVGRPKRPRPAGDLQPKPAQVEQEAEETMEEDLAQATRMEMAAVPDPEPVPEEIWPPLSGGQGSRPPLERPRIRAGVALKRVRSNWDDTAARAERVSKQGRPTGFAAVTSRRRLATANLRIECEAVPPLNDPNLVGERLVDATLRLASEHIRCRASQVLLPASSAGRMQVVASRGAQAGEVLRFELEVEPWIEDLVSGRDRATRFERLDTCFRYLREGSAPRELAIETALWVPIVGEERVIAVMLLINSIRPTGFTEAELHSANYLSVTVAERFARTYPASELA